MDRNKIKDYYSHEIEANRLELEAFKLEGIRTKEIIERYLLKTDLEILDIGGGAGYYSFWLQQKGHNVTLVDLSPKNIELVRKHSETSGIKLKKIETGDAVHLSFSNEQFDIVLLFGPLYHLIDRTERIKALSEAKKVLKPGGVLLAAVISYYASLFDGFQRDLVLDDQFFKLLIDDLNTGIHLNESDNLEYFTTAYFHRPNEIIAEIAESGLNFEKLIAVESFGWFIRNFEEKLKDPIYMEKLFRTIRIVESSEDLMAISPHIIAVAKRKE
ncbi:MAG TPA: class I SAM-dependent methyltransferase [Chitinophagaceae bacterium]|jgi:ubiquinone/menaquinone biosynthesis C-methylase UbiE|nr:class I SAM-dependent methyltransferase [Chitinophagaceae bacterium]